MKDALTLLKEMVRVRQLEQKALELSTSSPPVVVGSVHLCAGQEAVPVGTVAALRQDDPIVATYRGHGWALASGLSLIEVLGEICHREIGVNGGRGGSAYMMAPDRRFIGENSIVGAGAPIASGVALANSHHSNGRVTVVSLGDGAFNQGATHEALVFAAMRRLPLLFICENNGWSELTATSDTFTIEDIAQRAAAYGMPGITIDGTDPVVVRDAVAVAADRARMGDGPTLIECRVPRLWGHYNRDFEHYRSEADRLQAKARDPLTTFSQKLVDEDGVPANTLETVHAEVAKELETALQTVLNAPFADPRSARDHVWSQNESKPITRNMSTDGGGVAAEPASMTFIRAVNEALRQELAADPNVVVYGEDVGKAGGIFGASKGLQKDFGPNRVFDMPISESAILGSAVGAALSGMKPIVEIMWADFMLVALDQLVNQAANIRYVTRGRSGAPIVVRTQQGVTPGSCAQHSQSLEALLLHIPGLRVAIPSTPQDAFTLLRSAAASTDPCVVIEARSLYQITGPVALSDAIEPIGKAVLRRAGTDAVIVTWGTTVHHALKAAEALENSRVNVAVLDMRWLCPLDEDTLFRTVEAASGRVLVVHEANVTGGFGAEIVARLCTKSAPRPLRIARVGSPDVRMPAAPILQRELLPDAARIEAAVMALLSTQDAESHLQAEVI